MYKVISNKVTTYLENLRYVKKQSNGFIVSTNNPSEAQGILSKDMSTIYALQGKGLENNYEVAYLQKITLDQYTEEYMLSMLALMPDNVQATMIENDINGLLAESEV